MYSPYRVIAIKKTKQQQLYIEGNLVINYSNEYESLAIS